MLSIVKFLSYTYSALKIATSSSSHSNYRTEGQVVHGAAAAMTVQPSCWFSLFTSLPAVLIHEMKSSSFLSCCADARTPRYWRPSEATNERERGYPASPPLATSRHQNYSHYAAMLSRKIIFCLFWSRRRRSLILIPFRRSLRVDISQYISRLEASWNRRCSSNLAVAVLLAARAQQSSCCCWRLLLLAFCSAVGLEAILL